MATLNQVRGAMYQGARVLGDVQAVRKGRAPQRVVNILMGRLIARAMRNVWR